MVTSPSTRAIHALSSTASSGLVLVLMALIISGWSHFFDIILAGLWVPIMVISMVASVFGWFQKSKSPFRAVIYGVLTGLIGGFILVYRIFSNI